MDEDLIKLVNRLQDTFANLGARPAWSLLHRVTVRLLLNLTTHVMGYPCRWGAGHAPVGCGTQA
jgi:hypothetical protein